MSRVYTVKYKMNQCSEERCHYVLASSKEDAYEQATFCDIPHIEKAMPYSTWVYSVTYRNGNYKQFNTFEGKPY